MWLFHAGSDSEAYDYLSDEAERLWKEGVQAGRFPDDIDAEDDFTADYMADRMPLTASQYVFLERYQTMLRTLEFPTIRGETATAKGRVTHQPAVCFSVTLLR